MTHTAQSSSGLLARRDTVGREASRTGGPRADGGRPASAKPSPTRLTAPAVEAVTAQPIDHAHLARFTLGNRELELEVLQLFAGQAPITLAELGVAEAAPAWIMAAHTLKGSARAVGAARVAIAAEAAEAAGPSHPDRAALIARVAAAITEVVAYIDGLAVPA